MGRLGFWSALALSVGSLTAIGCGGHGRGFRVASDPITITSNALPTTLSGEVVNFCLPFTGGSGGPYLLEVIDGSLPPGVEPDSDTVCLVGRVLEDGVYDFKLKLTDTGSDPFTTSIQSFHWVINVGPLVFATDAALPVMVFAQFQSIPLLVAGGVPPYSCQVVDDVGNPNDEPLPTGLTIPADSCTIVGSPIGVKPASPFVYKVTVEARDHADDLLYPTPATVRKEFTITVLVPPVVITTTTVADGKCGTVYGDSISITDGIPPFKHELVTADVPNSTTRMKGDTASVGGIAKSNVDARAYPLDATAGPYSGKFPEGLYLDDASGALAGIPRRSGVFNAWMYHVQSIALPANPTQNAWKAYSFTMQNGTPPAIALDNAVLLAGNAFSTSSNFLQDPDAGKAYSKQFLATSGVPNDGYSDAPHKSERVALPTTTEVPGQYDWSHSISGVASLATLGMQFSIGGLLNGANPGNVVGQTRTGYVTLTVTAKDKQLPVSNQTSGTCRFSVGPDRIVITESTDLHTATNLNGTFAPLGSYNHVSFEYNNQSVYIWEPYASAMTVRTLASTDNTHTSVAGLPGSVTLATVLTSIDHMPVTVNPTWWAYDAYNLNARGARALQHADLQRLSNGEGYNADSASTGSMSTYSIGLDTFERNGDACIELPAASTVVHDPTSGVYNNGGQLRAFDGNGISSGQNTYFGFYIVRKDGKLYVPFAIDRLTSGFEGFGDAVLTSTRTAPSAYRRLQMTVSPDGRIGAVKMKKDVDNFLETIGAGEEIVLISLTGEAIWSGQTYRRVSIPTTPGNYMYGTSMALTNNALYYLTGNSHGMSNTDSSVIYSGHYVWRLDALAAASSPALLNPSFGGVGAWTNSSGSPLSTAFQRWAAPGSIAVQSYSSGWTPSTGLPYYGGTNYLTSGNPSKSDLGVLGNNWGNFAENSSAPIPFRVSASGKAMAIVAADGTSATGAHLAGTNFLSWGIYVDYYDSVSSTWIFRSASTTRRRYSGGSRSSGVRAGEYISKFYNWFQGPANQLELSDDGSIIAAIYNASTASWTNSASNGGQSNAGTTNSREDISILRAAGATSSDPWSSTAENLITSTTFTGSIQWRFGCLAFTRNATSMPGSTAAGAVFFWGGNSIAYPTSFYYGYVQASMLSGTMFQWNPNGSTWNSTGSLQSILSQAEGGAVATPPVTYTSGSPNSAAGSYFDPSNRGAITPLASFYSNDGRFHYIESMGPLTNGVTANGTNTTSPNDCTSGRLIGMQVLDTTTTITSTPTNRLPLRAFAVAPWPTDPSPRGFGPNYGIYYYWNPNACFCFAGGNSNNRVMTAVTGQVGSSTVFFTGYLQNNAWTTTNDSTTSFSGGGPINLTAWSDAASYAGDVMAFAANVGGGVTNLTNLGGAAYSTSRVIPYMQPNLTSTKVGFITTTTNSTNFSITLSDREQVRAVTNINFNASGALTTTPTVLTLEGTQGRASTSMSFDALDTRLYYAFGSSAGNENAMGLKEATFNATGTAVAGTRTQATGVAGTAARFAVLHSGR